MCRLITQPGDQWAYPGIVQLSVFDGVSLKAQSCGQNDVLLFLTEAGKGRGLMGKPVTAGWGHVPGYKIGAFRPVEYLTLFSVWHMFVTYRHTVSVCLDCVRCKKCNIWIL